MKKTGLVIGGVVLALAGGGAWWWSQRSATEAVQYRTAKIERGPLQATVSASGAVNPVTQVSVGTQVSGQIKELLADFNDEVKAGQLIAVIDPETFEYRVRSAQADLDSARATVLTAQANAAANRAAVSRARVDLQEAQRDFDRKQSLVEKQFIAQSEADRARALVNTTGEVVKSAEAQLGVTDAQIKSAQAGVAQRESALAQARIDLGRTRITSPVNGIVIKRTIEKGQTVAASLQAPELFVIAQNLQDMQVDASIDESDVGRVRTGMKASFTVDAFPGQTFEGQVRQVRKAAQNVANVVTYVAVIGFSNTGGRLLPGMTANVRVVTDSRESVLKVPNAGLRVRIAGVEPAAGGASGPRRAASGAASGAATGTTTGNAGGWSWLSQAHAQPAGPGRGLSAMRERLVGELQLTGDQQSKLDAIMSDLGPRFMGLRDMGEDERPAAREKLLAEMRGKINAMLDAKQKPRYAELLAQAQAQGPGGGRRPDGVQGASGAQSASPGAGRVAGAGTGRAGSAPGASASTPQTNARVQAAASTSPGGAGPAAALLSAPQQASSGAPAGVPQGTAPPPAGGGQATEFRNRLVVELALSPGQIEKVDAIYADVRPKFMQLRDLASEERPKARERILADVRARVGDVLTPEQKPKYQALLAETMGRTSTRGRIFLLGADGKPKAFNVRLGISDGTSTELMVTPGSTDAAELTEGVAIIVSVTAPAGPARPSGPRLGF